MYTPGASGARRAVEQSSGRVLVFLHQLPAWLPPVAVGLLLVVGLAVTGWPGAVALALVAAFLGWLAYVSWPGLDARGRLLRVAAITVLIVVALAQALR